LVSLAFSFELLSSLLGDNNLLLASCAHLLATSWRSPTRQRRANRKRRNKWPRERPTGAALGHFVARLAGPPAVERERRRRRLNSPLGSPI